MQSGKLGLEYSMYCSREGMWWFYLVAIFWLILYCILFTHNFTTMMIDFTSLFQGLQYDSHECEIGYAIFPCLLSFENLFPEMLRFVILFQGM